MKSRKKELSYLLAELRRLFPELQNRYHVETLEVFGSYVRSEQGAASDLDLLVTFSQLPGLLIYIELENYLSDKLGIKVDLVMRDSLKPSISKNIVKEAVPV